MYLPIMRYHNLYETQRMREISMSQPKKKIRRWRPAARILSRRRSTVHEGAGSYTHRHFPWLLLYNKGSSVRYTLYPSNPAAMATICAALNLLLVLAMLSVGFSMALSLSLSSSSPGATAFQLSGGGVGRCRSAAVGGGTGSPPPVLLRRWRSSLLFSSSNDSDGNCEDSESMPSSSSSSHPPQRREFLRTAAAGVLTAAAGSVGVGPAFAAAQEGATAVAPAATTTTPPIRLPPIGLGAWAWGDSLFWGYDKKNDDDLREVFDYALTQVEPPVLFDTAEVYGFGRSETLIGEFAKPYPVDRIQVATKFAALPYRTRAEDVVKACKASLQRLQRPYIDLYQVHFPNAWSNERYWDGLADCVDQGLVRRVGVSNYGVDATRACHAALAKRGVVLSTNQIQYSLLYRYPETDNGLLQCCKDLGVQVLSYSPLALGMLAGAYTPDKPPQGPRKGLYEKLTSTPDYENLLSTMRDVASGKKDATVAQVALNWARSKGTIPIPGARTLNQAKSNFGALKWQLSDEEDRALDAAARKVTTFTTPDMVPFPKEDINTHLRMFDS